MALNDVPKSGQTLNATRSPINNNFLGIDAGFSVDHEALTTPTVSGNAGKHKKVTLTQQGSTPTVGATEAGVYTKDVSGSPELFIKTGSDSEIDITSSITGASAGECTLPSGVKLKWGSGTTGATSTGVLTFTFAGVSLNNFNNIYSVQATAATTSAPGSPGNQRVARVDAYSTTGLTIRTLRIQALGGDPQNAPFTWFAIGD